MDIDLFQVTEYAMACGVLIQALDQDSGYDVVGRAKEFEKLAHRLPMCCETTGKPNLIGRLFGKTNSLYNTSKITSSMVHDYLSGAGFLFGGSTYRYHGNMEHLAKFAALILKEIRNDS